MQRLKKSDIKIKGYITKLFEIDELTRMLVEVMEK